MTSWRELSGLKADCRGATIVDWDRQTGRPDNARILMDYDQARFQAMARDALAVS